MALKKNYIFADITITDAYLRITDMNIEYNPEEAERLSKGTTSKHICNRLVLEVKSAKTKKRIDTWSSDQFRFVVDLTKNPIKQAYDYLKTLSVREDELSTDLSNSTDIND